MFQNFVKGLVFLKKVFYTTLFFVSCQHFHFKNQLKGKIGEEVK